MRAPESLKAPASLRSWLLDAAPQSERGVRMEALIARLRLVVLVVNSIMLAFVLDTSGMRTDVAWGIIGLTFAYAVPAVVLQPYVRWRLFRISLLTAAADSAVTATFIAATGAAGSPFFMLYYLSVAAVAMRFELRQALVACLGYAAMYSVVYFWNWDVGANAGGELALRISYMVFIAVGVGHLAREEHTRAQQIGEIERLHTQNQRLQDRNNKAARFDRLTGILNRAYFEKDALREIKKARSSSGYLSVLFCDMDRLKRINDELGHDAGDRVLRQVGAAMKHKLRSSDVIGRYGGDEFVVILPSITRETAFDRADQLIAAVGSVNESLPDDLRVGLSVGIATFPFDGQDYATLVRVADQAMYLAKREGGNRSRTSNDLRLFWEDVPHSA